MKPKLQYAGAMAAFGTISLFVRNIPISSGLLALLRAVIAIVCILSLKALSGKPFRLKGVGRDGARLFLSGAAMGFNWILLFEAYKYTTVSVATLSYYFAPVIVTLVSIFAFRERPTLKQLALFAGSTLGLVLVIGLGDLSGSANLKGVAFGLGAAALYATVILLNQHIHTVGGTDRTVLQFMAAVIVLTPYLLATEGFHLDSMAPTSWILLLIVGAFHTGAMYCVYFSSLRSMTGQEAAILSYIDPLVAVLISCTVLHEPMTALKLLGGALILGCTLADSLSNHPEVE